MGIHGIIPFIKKTSPNSIKDIKLSSLSGKKIAIDTSIYMYKFSFFNPNFLSLFAKMIDTFIDNDITPVFIFDGKPPKEKTETLQERTKKKEEINEKINKLKISVNQTDNNEEKDELDKELKRLEKTNIKITQDKVKLLKELLDGMNVLHIDAPCEAEKFCAWLQIHKKVDYCLSDDTDLIPLGCTGILRMFVLNGENIQNIDIAHFLSEHKIDSKILLDFCILCGCDYTCGIDKLGPVNSMKLLKKHNNIEGILQNEKKYTTKPEFDYIGARKLFTEFNEIQEPKCLFDKKPNKINEKDFSEINNKFPST